MDLGLDFEDEDFNTRKKDDENRTPISYNAKFCPPLWFQTMSVAEEEKMQSLKYEADYLYCWGDFPGAAVCYRKALERLPSTNKAMHHDMRESLARCCLYQKNYTEALKLAKSLHISANNVDHTVQALQLLCQVYHGMKRTEDEIHCLQSLISYHTDNGLFWLKLAHCYQHLYNCKLDETPRTIYNVTKSCEACPSLAHGDIVHTTYCADMIQRNVSKQQQSVQNCVEQSDNCFYTTGHLNIKDNRPFDSLKTTEFSEKSVEQPCEQRHECCTLLNPDNCSKMKRDKSVYDTSVIACQHDMHNIGDARDSGAVTELTSLYPELVTDSVTGPSDTTDRSVPRVTKVDFSICHPAVSKGLVGNYVVGGKLLQNEHDSVPSANMLPECHHIDISRESAYAPYAVPASPNRSSYTTSVITTCLTEGRCVPGAVQKYTCDTSTCHGHAPCCYGEEKLHMLTCFVRAKLLLVFVHKKAGSFIKERDQKLKQQIEEELAKLQMESDIINQLEEMVVDDIKSAEDTEADQSENEFNNSEEFERRWFPWIKDKVIQ